MRHRSEAEGIPPEGIDAGIDKVYWISACQRLETSEAIEPGSIPSDVLKKIASALRTNRRTGNYDFSLLPLKVRIYLAPHFHDFPGYDENLWAAEHKKIARLIKSGACSRQILESFTRLPADRQQQLLQSYPDLRLYKQFNDLLSDDRTQNKPTQLLRFIKINSTFVKTQLQFDRQLRENFLYSLNPSYLHEFKPLLQFIAQHKQLAQDFEGVYNRLVYANEPSMINAKQPFDQAKNIIFQNYLVRCLANGTEMSGIILKNPEHFSAKFVADITLRSGKNVIEEYREKLNSRSWKITNAIKSLFAKVSLTVTNLLFDTPPLEKEVIASIKSVIEATPAHPTATLKNKQAFKSSYARTIHLAPFRRQIIINNNTSVNGPADGDAEEVSLMQPVNRTSQSSIGSVMEESFAPLPSAARDESFARLPSAARDESFAPLPSVSRDESFAPLPSAARDESFAPLPSATRDESFAPLPSVSRDESFAPLPSVSREESFAPLPSAARDESFAPLSSVSRDESFAPLPSALEHQPDQSRDPLSPRQTSPSSPGERRSSSSPRGETGKRPTSRDYFSSSFADSFEDAGFSPIHKEPTSVRKNVAVYK